MGEITASQDCRLLLKEYESNNRESRRRSTAVIIMEAATESSIPSRLRLAIGMTSTTQLRWGLFSSAIAVWCIATYAQYHHCDDAINVFLVVHGITGMLIVLLLCRCGYIVLKISPCF